MNDTTADISIDAILLDDDFLVRMSWDMVAKQKSKKLLAFSEPGEFYASLSHYSKLTPVYIDSNLGKGVKGEDIALKVHQMGFEKIYLCTGYPESHFTHLTWLSGIVGKEAPWLAEME